MIRSILFGALACGAALAGASAHAGDVAWSVTVGSYPGIGVHVGVPGVAVQVATPVYPVYPGPAVAYVPAPVYRPVRVYPRPVYYPAPVVYPAAPVYVMPRTVVHVPPTRAVTHVHRNGFGPHSHRKGGRGKAPRW
jgi:hypothetical protein